MRIILVFALLFFSISAFSARNTHCGKRWSEINYSKDWLVVKAEETDKICAFTLKSKKNQLIQEIFSKQKGQKVIDGDYDFLGYCKVSYPGGDQMNCPVGTSEKISQIIGSKFRPVLIK